MDRTSLLIVRAHLERASATPLRVNVRQSLDVSKGFERAAELVDPDAVLDVVRIWLDTVQEPHDD